MTTSDLTCREFVEVITDFHELALPPGERIRVEQHLVVCSACTRYEEQLRAAIRVAATIEARRSRPREPPRAPRLPR